jgi:predicted enzyme related to lactoylglutathione lyase
MRLNQVTVPALDVEASIAFYQGLGLRLIVKALPHYARFECPDGGTTFSLDKVDRLPEPPGVVVYFECDELDAQVRALQARGYRFSQEPKDQPWLWREAHLSDPSGNVICLYRAGENRLYPPWRIAPST